jgi:hypothetical protein
MFYGAFLSVFPSADLNGADDRCHVMCTAALAACATTDKTFIDLDRMLTADAIALRSHHPRPKLVKNLKRCLITRECELPLELKRGLTRRLRRHEVTRPKPR